MPGHFTFYTEEIKNNQAVFSESESKHMVQVLRYSQGDIIEFTDGKGAIFKGSLLEANRKSVVAKVEEKTTSDIPDTVLVLGILKSSDRMETVVEKCVELGINTIHLMPSENSERKKVNLDKLHKTAIAAMKQSHGNYLPSIKVSSIQEIIQEYGDKLMLAHCRDGFKALPKVLNRDSIVCVGPEGDFSEKEIDLFKAAKATEISLGKRILRAETAAIAAITLANLNA